MTVSYERLFGDTGTFAVRVALTTDPSPGHGVPEALRASHGSFELWAEGRCLTRSVREDGSTAAGVTWYLLGLLEALERDLEPFLNEEPFPDVLAREEIGDATEWLEASDQGPIFTPTDTEYEAWFERRSEWFHRHALRFAFPGAAAPQVLLRRVFDRIEISWDNESWPAPRRDLRFVEPRGTTAVPAVEVANTLGRAREELRRELAGRGVGLGPPPKRSAHPWRWLVPHDLRQALQQSTETRDRLDAHAERAMVGSYCPHSLDTWVLRSVVADPPRALSLLGELSPATGKLDANLTALRAPRPPHRREPWREGYEAAEKLRADLGWDAAMPDLGGELRRLGVEVRHDVELGSGAIALLVAGANDGAAVALPRSPFHATPPMAVASALGHLLLDAPRGVDSAHLDSPRAFWPCMARARAFGAMLLMPEQAVRDAVAARGVVDGMLVRGLTAQFGLGSAAVTWHLKNLGYLSEEARVYLVAEQAQVG